MIEAVQADALLPTLRQLLPKLTLAEPDDTLQLWYQPSPARVVCTLDGPFMKSVVPMDGCPMMVSHGRRRTLNISHADVGDSLTPLVKPPISQEQLRRYADASGDYNPIHLDEEAAHHVGLDSVIAHGMLSMAFLGQFVTQQLADTPDAYLAHYQVRFMNMVRLGDSLTCYGHVKERISSNDGRETLTIECCARNQKGDKVTTGEAIVSLAESSTVGVSFNTPYQVATGPT